MKKMMVKRYKKDRAKVELSPRRLSYCVYGQEGSHIEAVLSAAFLWLTDLPT